MGIFSDLRRDISLQAIVQGQIVALVGYASSVAIVIQGLASAGASTAEIASGLMFLGLAKGLVAIGLSLSSRMPISIAWTTPGLALLATTGAVPGGFSAAVGAFIVVGLLIVLAGLWPILARLVAAIPNSIANAMLAGILLKLCLAPFVALKTLPLAALAIIATWLVFTRIARLYATPAAVLVTLLAVWLTGQGGESGIALSLPRPVFIMPIFNWDAMLNIALPMFIVTMASQNITGLAVLGSFGFRPDTRVGLTTTGVVSAVIAPFGAPAINYAAITAALCAGQDAHSDPARRYIAAVSSGVGYIAFALLAAIAASFVTRSSPVLIEAAAGLALIGAFGSALVNAAREEEDRIPAIMTFLVTASGLTLAGIGAAFWGLALGWGALIFLKAGRR